MRFMGDAGTPIWSTGRIFRLKDEVKILRVAKFEDGRWGTWSKRIDKNTLERVSSITYYTDHSWMHYIVMSLEYIGDTIRLPEE